MIYQISAIDNVNEENTRAMGNCWMVSNVNIILSRLSIERTKFSTYAHPMLQSENRWVRNTQSDKMRHKNSPYLIGQTRRNKTTCYPQLMIMSIETVVRVSTHRLNTLTQSYSIHTAYSTMFTDQFRWQFFSCLFCAWIDKHSQSEHSQMLTL